VKYSLTNGSRASPVSPIPIALTRTAPTDQSRSPATPLSKEERDHQVVMAELEVRRLEVETRKVEAEVRLAELRGRPS
jgi:hypothetical protein